MAVVPLIRTGVLAGHSEIAVSELAQQVCDNGVGTVVIGENGSSTGVITDWDLVASVRRWRESERSDWSESHDASGDLPLGVRIRQAIPDPLSGGVQP